MHLSRRDVLLDNGTTVPLSSFYATKPVALVFLRHFGCIFCQEHVASLSAHPDLNVVFVGLGDVAAASAFKAKMKTSATIICDPERKLYAELGVGRGSIGQLLNLSTIKHGIKAFREGFRNGRPAEDPAILGGTFVISTSGEVTFSQPAQFAGDNSTPEMVREALQIATSK